MTLYKTTWYESIQTKMIVIILIITTTVFGAFILLYYETTRTSMNTEINNLTEFFVNNLSSSLISPLWNYDSNSVEGIIQAMMQEKQIYAIVIKNNKNEMIAGRIRNANWECVHINQESFLENCTLISREITKDNNLLGIVEVRVTRKFMKEKMRSALNKMLKALIVLDTLLFLAFFLSIKRIIIAPIKIIVTYLSRLSKGDTDLQIAKYFKGEFNEILTILTILIETTNQITQAMESVSYGNLTIKIKKRSEHDRMIQALNQMIQSLNSIIKEIQENILLVGEGGLDIRGNAEIYHGAWYEVINGVNQLIDELSKAITEKTAIEMDLKLASKIIAQEKQIFSLSSSLQKSEDKNKLLSSVVMQSSEGMAVANLDGIMLFTNAAWVKMHGYDLIDELIGKHLSIFHSKEQVENDVIPFNHKLFERGYNSGEQGHIRKDGSTFPTLMNVTILKNDEGKPAAMCAICKDITDIKCMENEKNELIEALKTKNIELEKSSQELKDATQQLIQAGKMTVLGELTAGIAHELSQPLNGIKIVSQSLIYDIKKNRLVVEELDDQFKKIVDQVNRMAEIIQHMRIFTRQTIGESFEKTNINTIIAGAFNFIEQQMINNNIKVVKNLQEHLIVSVNPIRIEQVLLNLLSNARYALINSNKDEKILNIEVTEHDNYVAIHIMDNGIGIPDNVKEKLFTPFFTTKDPGQGTGLGLSISRKIIEEHKGSLEFESKYGEYTLFKIMLPLINS